MDDRFSMQCDFCFKHQDEVVMLVCGPGDVAICDGCIFSCLDMLQKRFVESVPLLAQWEAEYGPFISTDDRVWRVLRGLSR